MAPGEEGQREGQDSPEHVWCLSAQPELPLGLSPPLTCAECPAPGWPQVHKTLWGPAPDPHMQWEKGMAVGAQPGKLLGGFLPGGGFL